MRVHRALAVSVGDDHQEAPAAFAPARPYDLARAGRVDRCAHRRRQVDARVPSCATRTEAIAEDSGGQRPGERQRDRRRRHSERTERRGARDSVDPQPGPLLKVPQRAVDVRTEDSVEGPGGKAVLGELELKRGDVPAPLPEAKLAAADPGSREAAESLARLRPDDAVDRDVGPLLEATDRLRGSTPADPVDRAAVEPVRMQADLEGGDARIGRRGTWSDGRGDKD